MNFNALAHGCNNCYLIKPLNFMRVEANQLIGIQVVAGRTASFIVEQISILLFSF